jgi:hypothetical protein
MICGVVDENDNPVKLTEEQKKRFMKNMGKNSIFCEDNSIPKAMKIIAAVLTADKSK